jgi:putative salt-induced outer membrane protein YdiY
MRHRTLLALSIVFTFAPLLCADQVFLKNGDRLTGKIVKLTDGKMTFNSDLAGQISIDLKNIQTFSADSSIKVVLKDGTAFDRKIAAGESNQFAIESTDILTPQSFKVADIAAINPPPKPEPKWTGSISGGLTSTHGNTKADAVNASINLTKRADKDRIQVGVDYANGRQEDPDTGISKTTEDWWRSKAKYDYFFSRKKYAYVDGRYEKDSIAQLDRRMVIGGGGGYQWIESDTTKFSTELGLASLYEKFDNQANSNSELSAQAGYSFQHQLTPAVKFIHDLTYYPSLENFSDYYLTSSGELRMRFTERMFANFKAIFGYDATPAPGKGNTDVKYLLGVGFEF